MGHTHTFRMKTDKLFCLCPEVPLQVCLPGSSNVWLSRADRIQTEILSFPGCSWTSLQKRDLRAVCLGTGTSRGLYRGAFILSTHWQIYFSFFYLRLEKYPYRERSTRMKNDVPQILKCLRFKVFELPPADFKLS